MRILYIISLALLLSSCIDKNRNSTDQKHTKLTSSSNNFDSYWYDGEAEVNTFKLKQARYGQIHEGHANLIFVTEPFSKSKQVKLDNPESKHKISVLKLNAVRKFNTGLYPYSIMQSNFHPISQDQPAPLIKATFSAQEWCGQTFMQWNQDNNRKYRVQGFSYFESEGDIDLQLNDVYMEDEIWTQIRINPNHLPTGEMQIMPAIQELRLRHLPVQTQTAVANLKKLENGHMQYEVEYQDILRSLSIRFESEFPYRILSWTEKIESGFGKQAKILTTVAERIAIKKLPYWQYNAKEQRDMRSDIGLPIDCQ